MAEYNPSKIIKDGNTYNFRDTTKIPLAGSNAISGDLIPSTDGTVNLGSVSYQWNNAYIKSLTINGVACGDILTHNASEFVDVTEAQTIGGEKTFSNLRTYFGRDISLYSVRKYGKNLNPTANSYQYLNFSGNLASEGSTNEWSSGYFEQWVGTDGAARGRWFVQDTSENSVVLEIWASGNDKQVRPLQNGNTDLGTTNRKWKSLNGINPGALSLPSNNAVNILSALNSGGYTAPSNGYVRAVKDVQTRCTSTFGIRNETTGIEDRRITEREFTLGVIVPVQAGEKVIISDNWNSVSNANVTYNAYFYPCQGNV